MFNELELSLTLLANKMQSQRKSIALFLCVSAFHCSFIVHFSLPFKHLSHLFMSVIKKSLRTLFLNEVEMLCELTVKNKCSN